MKRCFFENAKRLIFLMTLLIMLSRLLSDQMIIFMDITDPNCKEATWSASVVSFPRPQLR